MKITYDIEEITDIVQKQAQMDLVKIRQSGEIEIEYVEDGSGRKLKSMTVEMED